MNVSRPQHRIYPVEKCGNPADIVGHGTDGFGSDIFELSFGKSAELEIDTH